MTSNKRYDLIIVGGGPAGATAALYANRLGLSAVILDKSIWPRDKICGDALSGKAVDISVSYTHLTLPTIYSV